MSSIQIETEFGPYTVEVLHTTLSGNLAIHAEVIESDSGELFDDVELLALTHVPTGYQCCVVNYHDQAQLVALSAELDALDWDFDDVSNIPAKTATEAKSRLRQFLLDLAVAP